MNLWKISRINKVETNQDEKSNTTIQQHGQFQEGTYEQVVVMFKISKQKAQRNLKEVSKETE